MEENSGDLLRKIRYSEGTKFLDRQHRLGFSYHIFVGNLTELISRLATIENPELAIKLHSQENRGQALHTHREANRLLHNFVTSAKTLIEHTRSFMKKEYHNTPIEKAYLDRVRDEFATDGLAKFFQDLRNYSLHKGIPNNSMSLKFTNGTPVTIDSSIYLEKKDLIDWGRWSGPARAFLAKQEDTIPLALVVKVYGEKITNFFEWLQTSLREHHKKDLEELETLNIRLRESDAKRRGSQSLKP